MSAITVTVDLTAAAERLKGLEKHIPFLAAYALTKTAEDVRAAEIDEMREVFDRPTQWTLNSLQVKPAQKRDSPIVAEVSFREFAGKGTPAWKYLKPEIEGGARRYKSHELRLIRAGVMKSGEWAVPGQGVTLDAHGNMPGALIEQILSQVAAAGGAGYEANITKRSRKRAIKKAGGRYFVMRDSEKAPNGIYLRHNVVSGIIPMIIFVGTPTYDPRFPIYAVAERVVTENLTRHFWEGFRRYVTQPAGTSPVGADGA